MQVPFYVIVRFISHNLSYTESEKQRRECYV